jgi:hypothetical protein
MGITASIMADRSGERLQKRSSHNVNNTWMDFSVTTHSHYKYHRVHVNVSMPMVESLLTRRISLIEIQVLDSRSLNCSASSSIAPLQGYHWLNNDITKAEDDEMNTACLSEINEFRKKKLTALCQEGGQTT